MPREDAGDRVRQMKLAFLAAHALERRDFRALDLSFYGWTWGPMSNEVCDAWRLLEQAALMESEEHLIVTRTGEALAGEFYEDVLRDERNLPVREVFDGVAAEWGGRALEDLLERVQTMHAAAAGEMALAPPAGEANALFIDDGWLETLALVLHPSMVAPIQAGVADFRSGRFRVA